MSEAASSVRSPLSDAWVKWSLRACVLGFGVFLLWATFVPLQEGVTAQGHVVVAGNRKQIQHFEGGIINQVAMRDNGAGGTRTLRDGDFVEMGETLLVLEPVQSESARDEILSELAAQSASLDRLNALRTGATTLSFTRLADVDLRPDDRIEIQTRQRQLFDQQRAANEAELVVLRTRQAGLEGRVEDLANQISATSTALASAREDLAMREQMLNERLETISNVQSVRREVAGLRSDRSRLIGERNEAVSNAGEVGEQILQTEAAFQQSVSEQIVDAQTRRNAARERLLGLDDRLARTVIRAPESGRILNLRNTTLGGVVQAGDLIMEIVPDTEDVFVTVRIQPTDRDAVQPGQQVEAQLTAYKQFIQPRLDGELIDVSADSKIDEQSGMTYYEARVQLDGSQLADGVEIIPGMPIDAFIASGQARSFFDYVFEPIRATMERGTRMN